MVEAIPTSLCFFPFVVDVFDVKLRAFPVRNPEGGRGVLNPSGSLNLEGWKFCPGKTSPNVMNFSLGKIKLDFLVAKPIFDQFEPSSSKKMSNIDFPLDRQPTLIPWKFSAPQIGSDSPRSVRPAGPAQLAVSFSLFFQHNHQLKLQRRKKRSVGRRGIIAGHYIHFLPLWQHRRPA